MPTTYAQKQSPAQKKDANTAASVMDHSSQGESLQRKADLANGAVQLIVQRKKETNQRPDHYFNDLPTFFSKELEKLGVVETPAMMNIRINMDAIRNKYSGESVHPGVDGNTSEFTTNMEAARNTYMVLKNGLLDPYNKINLNRSVKCDLSRYLYTMVNNSWDPDPRMDGKYPGAKSNIPVWISSWINYSNEFVRCLLNHIAGL